MSEGLPYARSFRDLIVYQKAFLSARRIFAEARNFPNSERFSLTTQILRSSRSIGAQLAEAWAKRKYKRHFISKLTDADGEQMETQHWVSVALDCRDLDKAVADEMQSELETIGRLLAGMVTRADSFCLSDRVRERDETCFTDHRLPITDYR